MTTQTTLLIALAAAIFLANFTPTDAQFDFRGSRRRFGLGRFGNGFDGGLGMGDFMGGEFGIGDPALFDFYGYPLLRMALRRRRGSIF